MVTEMKRLVLAAVAASLAACTTPAQVFEVRNSREYQASKDQVWERLIRHFATNNIQIKTLEKASGVVYAEREFEGASTAWWDRGRIGDLADCGKDFVSVPLAHSLQLNVFVADLPNNRASATVTVTFREIYDQKVGFGGAPKTCNSTGKLETKILDALGGP